MRLFSSAKIQKKLELAWVRQPISIFNFQFSIFFMYLCIVNHPNPLAGKRVGDRT